MHRPKHILEYALLRGLAWVINLLPHHAAHHLGAGLAWITHYVIPFRARAARERIHTVFGERFSEAEVRRIAWASWRNVCLNAIDVLRMPSLKVDDVEQDVEGLEVLEELRALTGNGQGVLLAIPHSGSWDMAGVICHLKGFPMFFIARRQKNPLTDEFLNQMRGTTGVETVLNDTTVLRGVIRKLKQGKVLAILPDVRSRTPALAIDFLGGSANLGAGMAMFSRQTGAPILPACLVREGLHRHRWQTFAPVYPDLSVDKQTDWERMTRHVLGLFDAFIREHPENYFWYNKRWVLDPLEPEP
jgi:KDO2-lipid IV(A) lauroyltransferase